MPTQVVTRLLCAISTQKCCVGEDRAIKRGYDVVSNMNFVEGNAENLPFENDTFDAYTIAFGIRNVTNIDKALVEANRVLKNWEVHVLGIQPRRK